MSTNPQLQLHSFGASPEAPTEKERTREQEAFR